MAEILPFRAVHYNPRAAGDLSKLVTQPYDKITAEMQARYFASSPYNLAHIIRGAEKPGDTMNANVYTRAAASFQDWIRGHALKAEAEPALYAYNQEYSLPPCGAEPSGNGTGGGVARKIRRGFIALCRLEDYAAGVVHRHEETHTGPKADRLELLKHTRAHFGQIFVLYSDPAGEIERALGARAAGPAWQQVEDEHATRHFVWRVTDAETIQGVAEAMRSKKLVIADGHHRYETALAYRDLRRQQAGEDLRAEYVMMTFVRLETDGLLILPTHRVLHSLERFDWGRLLAEARRNFEVAPLDADSPAAAAERLAEAGRERPTLAAYAGRGKLVLLRLKPDANLQTALADVAPSLARLDVVLLHRLLLEGALGISRQAVRELACIRYPREAAEALAEVDRGAAQVAFLLNPTPVSDVWENAIAGRVLPQKSTDFYPKLLSGLTVYWLDHPAGI
jgi:uncharacterized protein (DUF1015 family)